MEGILNEESLREEEGKNNQILLLINKAKKELISIIEEYINKNCVEFKKKEMQLLFEQKIVDLAESMSEGRIKTFHNEPPNGQENSINSNTKSNISSTSNRINYNSNSITFSN